MEVFDVNRCQESLERSKRVLLNWESAFMKEKGRNAHKYDLADAPKTVQHAHNVYVVLKRLIQKGENGTWSLNKCSIGDHNTLQSILSKPNNITNSLVTASHPLEEIELPKTTSNTINWSFRKFQAKLWESAKDEKTSLTVNRKNNKTLQSDDQDSPLKTMLDEVHKMIQNFEDSDDQEKSSSPQPSPKLDFKLANNVNKELVKPLETFCYAVERCGKKLDFSKEISTHGPRNPNITMSWLERCQQEIMQSGTELTTTDVTPRHPVVKRIGRSISKEEIHHPLEERVATDKQNLPTKRKADLLDKYNSADNGLELEPMDTKSETKKPRIFPKTSKNGAINGNYVRVDLKKKIFVRGKRKKTAIQYKHINYKVQKRLNAVENKVRLSKCHNCGGIGHFARFCMGDDNAEDEKKPDEIDDSPFPSIAEAAAMVQSKIAAEASLKRNCKFQVLNSINNVSVEGSTGNTNPPTEEIASGSSNESQETFSTDDTLPTLELVIPNITPTPSEPDQNYSELTDEMEEADHSDSIPNHIPRQKILPITASDEEMMDGLKLFGYMDFRPGQKEIIRRILHGDSTLAVLSTGSGKSLCYLLSAYLFAKYYPGALTICVSPLLSLMEDQVMGMPSAINGACLHASMKPNQREIIIQKVRRKKLHVLIVSPEALSTGLFGLLRNLDDLPLIPFACIDEVHCISEWSHNFRPSYLKLQKVLKDKLNVETFLGLTATATNHTISSICRSLNINSSCIVRGDIIPTNLNLSASMDLNRDEALMKLLRSERFQNSTSIIMYCTRREECERLASLIRISFTEACGGLIKKSLRPMSSICEAYHAGLSANRRKIIQKSFMAGNIRVVVATVAFGMGIDKPDIRAVIHFNMPKTFESYIQEIGRAGRDGLPAECHVFLDIAKEKDVHELRRHIYSNSIDRMTLRRLLACIFKQQTSFRSEKSPNEEGVDGTVSNPSSSWHEVSFSVEGTTQYLDLADENLETILCYLETFPKRKLIEQLPKCYHMCLIQSYGGTKLLKTFARKSPALAASIALEKKKKRFNDTSVQVNFNYVEVADTFGWDSSRLRQELKGLEWIPTEFDSNGKSTKFRKSGLVVEFSELAYRVISSGKLKSQEYDDVLNFLHQRNMEQERKELFQLHRIYQALLRNSVANVEDVCQSFDRNKSRDLKAFITDYFSESSVSIPIGWKPPRLNIEGEKEEMIRQDIRKLMDNYPEERFTCRTIARIFLGISSPCYPSFVWSKNRAFWRKHLDVDFHSLSEIAAQEIS